MVAVEMELCCLEQFIAEETVQGSYNFIYAEIVYMNIVTFCTEKFTLIC
jgi:hypothetical protein